MDAGTSRVSEAFRLLQPELLSVEELKELLCLRCVASETVHNMSKDILINLYRRVVQPLPQRECFHGQRKTKRKHSNDRVAVVPPETSSKGSGYTIGFNGVIEERIITAETVNYGSTANERLKPPPSVVDTSKKIKFNKSNSDLDNIVIINKRRNSQTTEEKQSTTVSNAIISDKINGPIVINNGKCQGEKMDRPKKVTLKRSFSQQVSATSKIESAGEEKKQRAKITWP